jgi:protein NUD1
MAFQPAWQTEDLIDEWPEEGDDISEDYTRSISLTIPVGSLHGPVHSGTGLSQDTDSDVADVVGTFLIRQDTFTALPQRLTAQKKGLIKDFFSPIALERMFDPPSPRTSVFSSSNPSARYDHSSPLQSSTIQTSSITSIGDQEGLSNRRPTSTSLRPDMSCPFTFSVPHPVPLTHIASSSPTQDQNATRTTTAVAPLTDPPLRLFQFQYDTFTRDHLSAMVDSIAVNSPSGSNTGNFLASTSSPFGLAPVSEASAHSSSIELRSAKRVKLSPPSGQYSLKSRTSSGVGRPVRRKDYVGESRFLMAQIKSARHSFSTPPSTASIPCPNPNDGLPCQNGVQDLCESRPPMFFILTDLWAVALSPSNVVDSPGERKNSVVIGPASAFKMKGHSSLGYRQQAESLMAQLKQDMKGSKRIFSIDATDLSPDDASRSIRPIAIPSPPYRTLQNQRNLTSTIQRGDSRKNSSMVALSST